MQSTQVARAAAALVTAVMIALAVSTTARAHAHRHGAPPLTFGIYAGGMAGLPSGALTTGPPDDPAQIQSALDRLQHRHEPFLVRAFTGFADQPAGAIAGTLPSNIAQYAVHGRKIDLVLAYASSANSQEPWIRWVKDMVHAYGPNLGAIQITEEANILNPPGEDSVQRVRQAIVTGVLAADEQLRQDGRRRSISVGMSVFAFGDPDEAFWQDVGRYATPRFRHALDYVGVDLYPDFIFGRQDISDGVENIIRVVREQSMPLAGLGRDVAIRVTENGWPTGVDTDGSQRTEAEQSSAVAEAVRAVSALRVRLNITHYEFWDLRDADSTVSDPWFQFGLLHSDYTPKPAFETYRDLVRRYG